MSDTRKDSKDLHPHKDSVQESHIKDKDLHKEVHKDSPSPKDASFKDVQKDSHMDSSKELKDEYRDRPEKKHEGTFDEPSVKESPSPRVLDHAFDKSKSDVNFKSGNVKLGVLDQISQVLKDKGMDSMQQIQAMGMIAVIMAEAESFESKPDLKLKTNSEFGDGKFNK